MMKFDYAILSTLSCVSSRQFGSLWLMPLQPCVDWWCRLHWPMLVASCARRSLAALLAELRIVDDILAIGLAPFFEGPANLLQELQGFAARDLTRHCPTSTARRSSLSLRLCRWPGCVTEEDVQDLTTVLETVPIADSVG